MRVNIACEYCAQTLRVYCVGLNALNIDFGMLRVEYCMRSEYECLSVCVRVCAIACLRLYMRLVVFEYCVLEVVMYVLYLCCCLTVGVL